MIELEIGLRETKRFGFGHGKRRLGVAECVIFCRKYSKRMTNDMTAGRAGNGSDDGRGGERWFSASQEMVFDVAEYGFLQRVECPFAVLLLRF